MKGRVHAEGGKQQPRVRRGSGSGSGSGAAALLRRRPARRPIHAARRVLERRVADVEVEPPWRLGSGRLARLPLRPPPPALGCDGRRREESRQPLGGRLQPAASQLVVDQHTLHHDRHRGQPAPGGRRLFALRRRRRRRRGRRRLLRAVVDGGNNHAHLDGVSHHAAVFRRRGRAAVPSSSPVPRRRRAREGGGHQGREKRGRYRLSKLRTVRRG
mmetsp:Transcript_4129/g.13259  ORF Transcript_4129/g.13259 Transcript_4129/m.13259 type:complete len:215 (+) Transcript_4129:753-1397(+)